MVDHVLFPFALNKMQHARHRIVYMTGYYTGLFFSPKIELLYLLFFGVFLSTIWLKGGQV